MKLGKKQIILTDKAIRNILGDEVDVLDGHSNKGKKQIVHANIQGLESLERRATGKQLFQTRKELDAWRSVQASL